MNRFRLTALACVTAAGIFLGSPEPARAQVPAVATSYYAAPAQAFVTYLPERRGLFGQRLVYRPVVSYAAPVGVAIPAPPVMTYYAPPATAAVTSYYAPAPVTTYRPLAPNVVAPPVSAYYAPVPTPMTTYRPVTPAFVSPPPVMTYYPPAPILAPVIVP